MRILGSNAPATIANSSAPRHTTTSSGFMLVAEAPAPRAAVSATALRTIGGLDALIALQSEADPIERRRRAIKRGRSALDALDELKHGLLAGTLGSATLLRLKSIASGLKDASGEPGLDTVLAEIELRVAVEIAKLTPR